MASQQWPLRVRLTVLFADFAFLVNAFKNDSVATLLDWVAAKIGVLSADLTLYYKQEALSATTKLRTLEDLHSVAKFHLSCGNSTRAAHTFVANHRASMASTSTSTSSTTSSSTSSTTTSSPSTSGSDAGLDAGWDAGWRRQ